MIEKQGDLFTTDAEIIGHGVNTHGVMGAGIAVKFRQTYPDMYQQYRAWCLNGLLNPGEVFPWISKDGFVFNIASQKEPGPNATFWHLAAGLLRSSALAARIGRNRIAIPRIGCGIGGLEYKDLEGAVEFAEQRYPSVEYEVWTL